MASSGFCVADRPMSWGRTSVSALSRSSDSAKWLPRLSRARAWISSTMTVRTARRVARAFSAVR